MFCAIGVLLGAARLLGELAHRLRQPAVLGELLAGVVLGPTILGNLLPGIHGFLFPATGPNALALSAITTLAVVLFLLVAGMEVDLSTVRRQGRVAPRVSAVGIGLSFAVGFGVAWWLPERMGWSGSADPVVFALFFATALSISALPVIAKTLMDLDLYRTDLGMIIVSAAIVDDLTGWIVFAILIGLMDGAGVGPASILQTIVLTIVFAAAVLTLGRAFVQRAWPVVQAYTRWPGGVLAFAVTLAFLGAAAAEWIGIHAIFGSFLAGVAIGDTSHLREHTRVTIDHFVSFIFAPVFFASIGLRVDFFAHFNLPLVVAVLAIACVCKLLGGMIGARWGGLPPREAWAVGFAMNSRGAMEIILGLLALELGIIGPDLFVALVVMAIVTSMMSGPLMRYVLQIGRVRRLPDLLRPRHFVAEIRGTTRFDAIAELAGVAAIAAGIDAGQATSAVWTREETMSTGLGNGVALPHARLEGLEAPVLVVGIAPAGIDFDAPDGRLSEVIFLALIPVDDPGAQLHIAAEVARLFREPEMARRACGVRRFTEFLSLLRGAGMEPASQTP